MHGSDKIYLQSNDVPKVPQEQLFDVILGKVNENIKRPNHWSADYSVSYCFEKDNSLSPFLLSLVFRISSLQIEQISAFTLNFVLEQNQ